MTFLSKSNYRWVILIACMLVYCTSQLVRWNYASITKYLMEDLHIGKPELGLLGSAFFYAYAVAQIPWGTAADVWGSRRVIPVGIGILALFLAGFAFSGTFTEALIWRAAMGVVAAAGYVPITSALAKWFSIKERGFAMEMYSGPGGGLGEVMTFLLIPIFAVVLAHGGLFGVTGWRASTILMAMVVFVIAMLALLLLRASPTEMGLPSIEKQEDKEEHQQLSYRQTLGIIAKDPALWIMSLVWSAYMVATRLVPGWLPLYATDFYIQEAGMSKEAAIIAGGGMASVYVIGRVVGTPGVGWLSDKLLKHGIPRAVVIGGGLVLIGLTFFLFTLHIPNTFSLAALAFFAGVVINIFPLINASAAEIWSVRSAGFTMGIINMVGQFAGAIALSVSGFMAAKFSYAGGAFYTEFVGIWYLGIITSILGALATLYMVVRERRAVLAKIAKAA
ncbi:MFS transporter [Rhodoplanes sp. TEM]|uniref:MFS transporter n=1 Tax=Rhodoplanes tepidamans TaxID=200616 RepID=A0ABT5J7E6_RHOTP|nr:MULTISPECIES: MFS transporter [Rhodoplanes]MDC7785392.1 MFS transporter [Rhodoplanes tepidamans]MDC7984351.1 MFS transporter [Rhodoplanes sp. TEM]MDQ0353155.1 sugar phosphate permease [Rhodoplanes tepidamans]